MNIVKLIESNRPAITEEPPVAFRCDFEGRHWGNAAKLHVSRDTKGRAVFQIGEGQVHLSAEDAAELVEILRRGRE